MVWFGLVWCAATAVPGADSLSDQTDEKWPARAACKQAITLCFERRPSHQTWQQSLLWLTPVIPLHPIPQCGQWLKCPCSNVAPLLLTARAIKLSGVNGKRQLSRAAQRYKRTAYQPLPTISLPALPAAKLVLTFLPLRCPVRTRHTMSDSNEGRKGHGCWCPASKIKWN